MSVIQNQNKAKINHKSFKEYVRFNNLITLYKEVAFVCSEPFFIHKNIVHGVKYFSLSTVWLTKTEQIRYVIKLSN